MGELTTVNLGLRSSTQRQILVNVLAGGLGWRIARTVVGDGEAPAGAWQSVPWLPVSWRSV
jgi:hypothetical protein